MKLVWRFASIAPDDAIFDVIPTSNLSRLNDGPLKLATKDLCGGYKYPAYTSDYKQNLQLSLKRITYSEATGKSVAK